jgi:hypothetical protein
MNYNYIYIYEYYTNIFKNKRGKQFWLLARSLIYKYFFVYKKMHIASEAAFVASRTHVRTFSPRTRCIVWIYCQDFWAASSRRNLYLVERFGDSSWILAPRGSHMLFRWAHALCRWDPHTIHMGPTPYSGGSHVGPTPYLCGIHIGTAYCLVWPTIFLSGSSFFKKYEMWKV